MSGSMVTTMSRKHLRQFFSIGFRRLLSQSSQEQGTFAEGSVIPKYGEFLRGLKPNRLQRLEMMSGNRVPFLGIRGPRVLLRLHSEHLAVEGEAVVKIADSPALVDEVLPVRAGVPDVPPLAVRLYEPEQAFVVDLPLQFDFLQEGAKGLPVNRDDALLAKIFSAVASSSLPELMRQSNPYLQQFA